MPQGSVLSPLLWAILASDIPQSQNTTTLVLADDVTFSVTADTVEKAQEDLQRAVDEFSIWVTQWGLTTNPTKSRIMCFSRKRINAIPQISVEGEQVPFVTRHIFLGMHLDAPRLTWKHHISYLKTTCTKRVDMMKRIAGKSWGANRESLQIFYKSFIE